MQAAYLAYLKRYGTHEEASHAYRSVGRTHLDTPCALHLGTTKLHPRTFTPIGLLPTGVDPTKLAKQGTQL